MTEPQSSATPGPYATAAPVYWKASWRGILPLPAGTKGPVPKGYTGNSGAWPSYPDVQAWTEDRPDGNIALRLPPDVLGIDVDAYDSKAGGLVLAALEQQVGALPATWRTTSRDDGVSGIRLYRIPVGLRWPGVLGPGIETIRHEHRYAVVWPSAHPNGGTYRWITPEGATSLETVPTIDELPELPAAWVEHFTRGEIATDQARAELADTSSVAEWVRERGQGEPCRHMASALASGAADLTGGSSRHEAALALTNRLVWIAGEGHTGGAYALAQARSTFLIVAAKARDGLEGEWDRMVEGAVRMAAAEFPTPNPDPCLDPFHGLIPKEDNPWKATAPTTTSARTAGTLTTPSTTARADQSSSAVTADGSSVQSERTRTTWWPRSIEHAITGESAEAPPEFLVRDDGAGMFYAGRVNGIIGPSESGKTWVALQAVKQAAAALRRVTILDFEDSDRGVVKRLSDLSMGATELRDWVRYINPDEPFSALAPSGLDLLEHLEAWRPELIILDGFNAAMTLQGLDLMSNKDATLFSQLVLKPLTRNDACVVYIDHVPKSKDNTAAGGIGAQAKRAMTTGCTLKVDPVKPFGKGQDGRLRVYVDKDRPGQVRGVSAASNGTHWAGDAFITTGPDDAITVDFRKPEGLDVATGVVRFRPTFYMEKVSTWLAANPDAGRNDIVKAIGGKKESVTKAINVLVEEGWVAVEKEGAKHAHRVARHYSETAELIPEQTSGSPGSQVGPRWVPDPPSPTGSLGPTGSLKDPVVLGPSKDTHQAPAPGRIVERTVGGERVRLNLDTGEMTPL